MNIEQYLAALRQIKSGSAKTFTKDELVNLIQMDLGMPNEELIAQLLERQKSAKPEDRLSADDISTLQNELRKQLTSPAYKQQMLELAKDKELAARNEQVSSAIRALAGGMQAGAGLSQRARYRRMLRESQAPGVPPVLGADPYLEAAKRAAEQGTYQESIAAEAAKQMAREGYMQDIANARLAAGGQTGAFGAYGQAASTRQARRMQEMAPQIESIRQARQAERARLAGLSVGQQEAINRSMGQYYPYQMQRYLQEQQAIGELGQAGSANIYGGLQAAAGNVAPMISGVGIRRKYQDLTNRLLSMGVPPEKAAEYTVAAQGRNAPNYQMYGGTQAFPTAQYPSVEDMNTIGRSLNPEFADYYNR